jgi:glycosyltransferase involved in cell wall biosynthesis
MTVTVCIPVYNNFRYVEKAVASVNAQTVPAELIVVDDGSTLPYQPVTDERVVRVTHRGPQNAWNAALMLAQGEWFVPLASDDWLEPDFLAEALDQSDGADVVAVTMRQHGQNARTWRPRELSLLELWRINEYPYCALYCTETIREMGGWHGQLSTVADWGMWIDLTQRGARFAFAPDAIFNYLVHDESHSASLTAADRRADLAQLRSYYPGFSGFYSSLA